MREKNEDVIRVCMQVKKLVDMRDKYVDVVIKMGNVVILLYVYVQHNAFSIENAIYVFILYF